MTKRPFNTHFVKRRAAYIIISAIMGIITAASCLTALLFGASFSETDYLRLMISLLGMMFALALFLGCGFSLREDLPQGHTLTGTSVLLYLSILLSGIFDILSGTAGLQKQLELLLNITSLLSMLTHLLIWIYQCASLPKTRMRRIFAILISCDLLGYFILLAVNLFTPILFYVDEAGRAHYSGVVFEILNGFFYYTLYLLYALTQHCSLRKKLSVASFALFPLLYCVLSMVWYASGMTYSVLSTWYVFLLLAAYVVFFGDYIESRALVLRQKAELAEKEYRQTELQTQLMLSQIRPHFLYNSLSAIRHLCRIDSEKAYVALGSFADYLRSNMDALGGGRMVPFCKEIEHVKTYLMLEQLRFGDELRVEYDIRYQDFSLPALTIQPVVENAVCHGALQNENGGVVIIRTKKTLSGAVITVSDNGPGFDPSEPPSDGHNHYGLSSVRTGLAATGCGELQMKSTPGVGTTVIITIWEKNDECSAC